MKYATADIKKSTIRCDQLITHIKKLHDLNKDGHWFPEEGMYKVAEILMAHHKENVVDYTQKYGLTQLDQPAEVKEEPVMPYKSDSTPIEETPIYKELREYRLLTSRSENIKPYYIFNNAQMEQIISLMPETYDQIKQINGFADGKCNKYGDAIINIIKKNK